MRPRNLLILVVIAAVLAGAAVIKNKRQRSADESSAMGTKLLVDVDLNKVAALSIRSADGSVELAAQEDGAWVASGRFGYPARFSKIRDFVLKLAELKIGFTVTADDQDRGLLKLLPPGGEAASNSAGTEVKLRDAAGATLAAFT